MEYTEIIKEEEGRKLTVNSIEWGSNPPREGYTLQLTVMQHDDEAYIDLNLNEAIVLKEHIEDWIKSMQ